LNQEKDIPCRPAIPEMNTKKQHISFLLAKLPLIVLYALFFVVQLFYNFDIPSQRLNTAGTYLLQKNGAAGSLTGIKKAASPADQKTVFRLNKRYQPQPAIASMPLIIRPLVCLVSSKLHVHYSSGFTPSAFPVIQPLRGPPVV
jgi:hypothetical protein